MTALRPHRVLSIILLLYLILGVLFAVYTPPWQAPDEPAHYNYVRYLVRQGGFPVLQMGDYPHAYLEQIKAERFPANVSIDPIRYEFHQPPLYYALAAPLFALTGGALLPLRLFSVLLGGAIVWLAYLIAGRIYPARPGLALGAAAFVAFLPQHLATVSQVGNDVLAELLFGVVLLQLVGWALAVGSDGDAGPALGIPRPASVRHARFLVTLGLLLGLVLVTKTTAYIAVPLAGGVLLWTWWRARVGAACVVADLALVALPAALLALPWYLRDIQAYGWPDVLGLARHDSIVVGQTRTAQFLAEVGWGAYLARLFTFTFKSFWGVFGWLGVFMDGRVYTALGVFSAVIGMGLLVPRGTTIRTAGALTQLPGSGSPSRISRNAFDLQSAGRNAASHCNTSPALRLLALSALCSVLVYGWYNLQFVQHQGRYLFTALIPVAIGIAVGWERAIDRRRSRWLAAGLLLLAALMLAFAVATGQGMPRFSLAIVLAAAGILALRPWLASRFDGLLFAAPYVALPLLALYALFGAIIPQLG